MPTDTAPTLAIDIGGTKIRAGLVAEAQVLETVAQPTAPVADESVLDRVIKAASNFTGFARIGVASAGVIREGRVTHATDLIPGWAGTDIASGLRERFGVPVSVLGDAHAHGLGEAHYGAGRGADTVFAVAVGTGIGGAVINRGVPVRGGHGAAGHIGHVTHPASATLRCSCGRFGHIEALSSGHGIAAAYARRSGGTCTGAEVARRAADGETAAVAVLEHTAHALGEVIGSLANVLDPDTIVLSGSVTTAGSLWWEALRRGYRAGALDATSHIQLTPGVLGDEAPLLGAAAFAEGTS